MTLKKTNALLALLSTVFLLAHIGVCVYSYYTFVYLPVLTHVFAGIASVCIMAHAAISVFIVVTQADGLMKDKYPRMNIRTNIQRISGILILLMLPAHIKAFNLLDTMKASGEDFPLMLFLLSEAVFFGIVILHAALSLSKAFISLGLIISEQTKKKVDCIVYIAAVIVFIVSVYVILKTQMVLFLE